MGSFFSNIGIYLCIFSCLLIFLECYHSAPFLTISVATSFLWLRNHGFYESWRLPMGQPVSWTGHLVPSTSIRCPLPASSVQYSSIDSVSWRIQGSVMAAAASSLDWFSGVILTVFTLSSILFLLSVFCLGFSVFLGILWATQYFFIKLLFKLNQPKLFSVGWFVTWLLYAPCFTCLTVFLKLIFFQKSGQILFPPYQLG